MVPQLKRKDGRELRLEEVVRTPIPELLKAAGQNKLAVLLALLAGEARETLEEYSGSSLVSVDNRRLLDGLHFHLAGHAVSFRRGNCVLLRKLITTSPD